jgi:hypothetical protein
VAPTDRAVETLVILRHFNINSSLPSTEVHRVRLDYEEPRLDYEEPRLDYEEPRLDYEEPVAFSYHFGTLVEHRTGPLHRPLGRYLYEEHTFNTLTQQRNA